MPRIICPFCPHMHDTSTLRCPDHPDDTNYRIPLEYINDYQRKPPLWLMTLGFSKHGKTTFLSTLTMMLERLGDVMPGMWYWTLDSYTYNAVEAMRREMREGRQPQKTTLETKLRPLLFQVNDMPGIPSRCLVLYDVAGEAFDTFDGVEQRAANMKQVNTAWFLVSLPDLLDGTRRMADLFMVYLTGLRKLQIDFRGWNLIVVYTKADKHQFTGEIDEYIDSDPLLAHIESAESSGRAELDLSLESYVERMRRISGALERYTAEQVEGGNAFISAVRSNGMNLVFAVTSALGEDPPENGKLLRSPRPHRVIDPLLWALQLEAPPVRSAFSLVVDANGDATSIYEQGLVEQVWKVLSDHGEVTTYYLGQSSPTASAEQAPPRAMPQHSHPRLAGPILDSALESPSAKVVLLTTGRIRDLDDYDTSPVRDRTLLIKVENDFPASWPNCRVLRSGDDPAIILEDLKNLSREGES